MNRNIFDKGTMLMLRNILAIVIVAHGIGHVLFLVPLLGIADWGQSTQSWLFRGDTFARLVGSLLWLTAIIGFCMAAYGLWNQLSWWSSAALIASLASAVGLVLFWANPPTSSVFFAFAFNVAVIGLAFAVQWLDFKISSV
jgi:hypothetical protein